MMGLLKKKPTDTLDLDFRSDPTLVTAGEKLRSLSRRLVEAKRETEAAQQAMFEANEALETALLDELLERGTAQAVVAARTAYQQAQATYNRLNDAQGPTERAVALLQKELADLEHAAQQKALPRFQGAYADAVSRLAKILEEAEAANAEVVRLYRAGRDAFDPQFLIDRHIGDIPDLSWREFVHNPNAQDGGRLGHWRTRAEEVMQHG